MSQNSGGFGEVVTWGGSKEAGIHCGLRSARNQGNPRIVSKSIRSPERLQTKASCKWGEAAVTHISWEFGDWHFKGCNVHVLPVFRRDYRINCFFCLGLS